MAHNISFPGKTFLIGEYAVLEKAPAILVNTKPRFYFSITKGNCTNYFHPESPAGQWLKKYPQISESYCIESWDPYYGEGGFGLSSAQFNLVYLLDGFLKGELPEKIDLFKMWKAYRSLEFSGQKPSGADIISQWMGDLCVFVPEPFKTHSVKWPFPDLDFFLIRTGVKLNTWEHLNQIQTGKHFSHLSVLAKQGVTYVENSDTENFVSILKEYADCLEQENLVHEKTQNFLNELKKIKQIITTKGCGALGAEVVVVFFHPKDKETVINILNQSSFLLDRDKKQMKVSNKSAISEYIIANSSHLSQGMTVVQEAVVRE